MQFKNDNQKGATKRLLFSISGNTILKGNGFSKKSVTVSNT
jgi:hypothetical protein